jgi:chorismate dehydratase
MTRRRSVFAMKDARIGAVKYLNARPLIHGWPGEVVLDHPAALCAELARGDLDVALVSSFEFMRNPIYRIIDDIAIASEGEVYSVIVAYDDETPLPEIELDAASVTSIALLNCLVSERGEKFHSIEAAPDQLAPLRAGRSRLLIGDQAIRFRERFGERYHYWDLGEEWRGLVKLPFVYALWLIRPEFGEANELANRLRGLRDENLGKIDNLIAQEKEFDPVFCRRYFTRHLRFTFGEQEKKGLRQFQRLCVKHKLLPERELSFDLV